MRLGIHLNEIDFYSEYKIYVKERFIGNPDKNKILERVPFSNETLDFSSLYGTQTFQDRPLKYVLSLSEKSHTRQGVHLLEMQLTNALMAGTRGKLIDEMFPGYYFEAEVQTGPNFERFLSFGELTVDFIAYPFKKSILPEGNDYWDPFNFELDISQTTEFTVTGTQQVTLWNVGISQLNPTIRASAPMQITTDSGNVFIVPPGESKSYDLMLLPGENSLYISGTGSISFVFYKEVI
ncbi:phage tail protein [Carnobacterium maltaromaticum]|uniref:phage tail protein n=1 Tax=Carnobacterium maltaromaticum TaxID=2751 RepID=UPI0039BDD370